MGWEYRPGVQGTYLLEVEAGQAVGVAGAQRSSSPEGVITVSRASILASCQCHTPDTLNRTMLCLDVLSLILDVWPCLPISSHSSTGALGLPNDLGKVVTLSRIPGTLGSHSITALTTLS